MNATDIVKKLKAKYDCNQTELAKLLKVHPLTVHRWETGKMGMHSAQKTLLEGLLK